MMKNLQRPTYSFLILVIGLILITAILSRLSNLLIPATDSGVTMFYFVLAFTLLFTFWFGAYGAIASYVGCFFGSGILSGMPASVAVYWALASLWQVLIPLVAFRVFNVDVGIEDRRDLFHLILFGVIINNIVGAAWGSVAMAIGGIIPGTQILSVFTPWLIGNMLVTILIVPLALHYLTPKIRKSKLFVKNYWY
jgi:hypothetical protein